ncbi:DUF5020 family protein [Roseimarinus sediminis]|uniref:DUF5020 family protein n=1 Tax=Roseimarinus sediminis TaxID=1610899 RepID=UPI003D1F47A6
MRKLTLIALLVVASLVAKSQNLQMHYDFGADRNYLTTTLEQFKPDAMGSTFFFVDFNYDANGATEAYWEIARELKKWDAPVSVHVEFNGGLNKALQFNNAYLLGGTYSWNAADFSKGFSLSAMYKLIQGNSSPHNGQLTAVWYLNLLDGKVSFTGFADLWTEKHTVSNDGFVADFQDADFIFLSEPQLWYNINKSFSLGGEVELAYHFAGTAGFKACPTLAAKWTF